MCLHSIYNILKPLFIENVSNMNMLSIALCDSNDNMTKI